MKFINKKVSFEIIDIPNIWKKYESRIIKEIYRITKLRINTRKIKVIIDTSTSNGYYGNNKIFLGVKGGISKDDVLMVITHELFHIFYWKKLKMMKLTKSVPGKESKNEWKLSEITAYLITKESNLMKYWPKAQVSLYPEIKETYKKVKKYWAKKDFEYFLTKSYLLIK